MTARKREKYTHRKRERETAGGGMGRVTEIDIQMDK